MVQVFQTPVTSWCLRTFHRRRLEKYGWQGTACPSLMTKEKRWVIARPFKICTNQLADEIVTYADFQTFGRPGIVAARLQLIRLIERFPEPPIGDPKDLEELKYDLDVISAEDVKSKTLQLEDEVRCRLSSKLALYSKPSTSTLFGMPDRRCPCCLAETPSCLAKFASSAIRSYGPLEKFKELNLREQVAKIV